jgi:ubiquinone biosynthesis accessory factor UbiJ
LITRIFEDILNQYLKLDPDIFQELSDLEGRCIKIQVTDLSWDIFLLFKPEKVEVYSIYLEAPDACIMGTSWQLFGSTFSEMAGKSLNIEGDVELGYQFYGILKHMDIDWEEHLSRFTGDIFAHQVGQFGRALVKNLNWKKNRIQENITEFIQAEKQLLPSKQEVEDFSKEVETLRQRADRLMAYFERSKSI